MTGRVRLDQAKQVWCSIVDQISIIDMNRIRIADSDWKTCRRKDERLPRRKCLCFFCQPETGIVSGFPWSPAGQNAHFIRSRLVDRFLDNIPDLAAKFVRRGHNHVAVAQGGREPFVLLVGLVNLPQLPGEILGLLGGDLSLVD